MLVATNPQIVLDVMIADPARQFIANEIQKSASLSRAGVNFALRQLVKQGLVRREKKANLFFYSVDPGDPVVRQLKILRTTLCLIPLVKKLRPVSEKIVLFGSCARGEDTARSDIDLLVISLESDRVKEIGAGARRLQLMVNTPVQYAETKKSDPVFREELLRGIILWENRK